MQTREDEGSGVTKEWEKGEGGRCRTKRSGGRSGAGQGSSRIATSADKRRSLYVLVRGYDHPVGWIVTRWVTEQPHLVL